METATLHPRHILHIKDLGPKVPEIFQNLETFWRQPPLLPPREMPFMYLHGPEEPPDLQVAIPAGIRRLSVQTHLIVHQSEEIAATLDPVKELVTNMSYAQVVCVSGYHWFAIQSAIGRYAALTRNRNSWQPPVIDIGVLRTLINLYHQWCEAQTTKPIAISEAALMSLLICMALRVEPLQ